MFNDFIPSILLLIGGFIVFVFCVRLLRRRVKTVVERPAATDFDIATLHGMLTAGKIDADEFDRLKALIIARKHRTFQADNTRTGGFEVLPASNSSRIQSLQSKNH